MTPLSSGIGFLVAGISLALVKQFTYADQASLWPEGQYGLPKPIDGCPKSSSFTWETGMLFQDCEDTNPQTSKSPSYHLAGYVNNDVLQEFCVKTNTINDSTKPPWPTGQYCIYQKGDECPSGLDSGWVVWDDESEVVGRNRNARNGTLPKGIYNRDTKMYFCCSTKGSKTKEIDLPLASPFFLIAHRDSSCQRVRGATATREFIYYETEYYTPVTKNDYGGAYPYRVTRSRYGHTIYYCYYRPNYCPPLSNSINGRVYPPRCTQANSNVFNDSCTARCNPGYFPRNSYIPVSVCGEDGRWNSTSTATCIPKLTPRGPTTTRQNTTSIPHLNTSNYSINPTHPSIKTPHGSSDSKPVDPITERKQGKSNLDYPSVSTSFAVNTKDGEQQNIDKALSEDQAGFHSPARIVAGSISGTIVLLGVVFIICISLCRKGNLKKKDIKRKRAMDKSKSLEELVTGRRIVHRTVSKEHLIYADPGSCQVEYTVKTDENPLYESFDCPNLQTPPDRKTDNILYESVSPLLPSLTARDVTDEPLPYNYKPTTL